MIYTRRIMDKVRELAQAGKILAADAIGRGGLYMTLVKMAVGNKIGADVKIDGDVLAPTVRIYGAGTFEW